MADAPDFSKIGLAALDDIGFEKAKMELAHATMYAHGENKLNLDAVKGKLEKMYGEVKGTIGQIQVYYNEIEEKEEVRTNLSAASKTKESIARWRSADVKHIIRRFLVNDRYLAKIWSNAGGYGVKSAKAVNPKTEQPPPGQFV